MHVHRIEPGAFVAARGHHWKVVTVVALGHQTMYRLRCLEHKLRALEIDIIHPIEEVRALNKNVPASKKTSPN